jgi:hypothetical protein
MWQIYFIGTAAVRLSTRPHTSDRLQATTYSAKACNSLQELGSAALNNAEKFGMRREIECRTQADRDSGIAQRRQLNLVIEYFMIPSP